MQGSANLEFWETFDSKEIYPYLTAIDNRLRAILATVATDNAATDSTAVETADAKAVSAADSLAAALKGEPADNAVAMEQMKKRTSVGFYSSAEPERQLCGRLC